MRKVIISITGGVATVEAASEDVEVVIVDFDNLGGEEGEKRLDEEMNKFASYEH